jgi:hypothetical protein
MKENFHRLKAFLKRDIRSFFRSPSESEQSLPPYIKSQYPQNSQSTDDVSNTMPESVPLAPLPLLLNPDALNRVVFRREILDWRDKSILQLCAAANTVLKAYSAHVVSLLNDLPFWRRAVSQAANEVLAKDFNTRVRLKIRQEVNKYDQQLDKIMGRRQRDKDSRSRIIDEWPDSQLSYVANMGFKPANQNDILDAISFLVLGPHGIVDKFYLQITKVSTRIIEEELS